MKIVHTSIAGLDIIETQPFRDHRGEFARFFCVNELAQVLGHRHIVQINRSLTRFPGSVRGMHYQYPPHAELKLVRCIKGRVLDVAIDIRAGSHSFLKWEACELSAENALMFAIPEGFAHGFQVLEADSELVYLTTAAYHRPSEGGIQPEDPSIAIRWALPVTGLSDRDRTHPLLGRDFAGVTL
jgi:dTDP-4-dehydrorhamnose 3,5-epimerase